jgi:hypothetical protein
MGSCSRQKNVFTSLFAITPNLGMRSDQTNPPPYLSLSTSLAPRARPRPGCRIADVDTDADTIGMGIGMIMEMGTSPEGNQDHDGMNLNHGIHK